MSYGRFLFYTTLGAGAWHSILALLGHYMHAFVPEEQLHDRILEYGEYIKVGLILLVVMVCAYFIVKCYVKRKRNGN